jgi:hypothetical protein
LDEELLPALFALTWDPKVSFGESGAPEASKSSPDWSFNVLPAPTVPAVPEVEADAGGLELVAPALLLGLAEELPEAEPPEEVAELELPDGLLELDEPELPELDEDDVGAVETCGGDGVPPPMLLGAHAGEPTTDPVKMRFTQFWSEKM